MSLRFSPVDRQLSRASAILTNSIVYGNVITNEKNYKRLAIEVTATKASVTGISLEVVTSNQLYHSLAYDGQTANFTVGETVTGGTSGAEGVVISDTDGGATGTLILQMINNEAYIEDEVLTGDTTGIAVANGTQAVSDTSWHKTVGATYSAGTDTLALLTATIATAGLGTTDRFVHYFPDDIVAKYIKIGISGAGTVTSSAASVYAVLSNS